MAREIKFRLWDNLLHKFTYFDVTNTFFNIPLDSRENLQEFTGLKDKNNQDIYEGDILQEFSMFSGEPSERYLCQHQENPWNSVLALRNTKKGWNYGGDSSRLLIIGNVFENPELLK